eukprot:CAMPEP_0171963090 /NCGR_PEP_ID=MMETSP0993-20121228/173244_1 /TAXON_ID=483369 /ORGANISM="non described non described, Strain CCMP2098" /LENGTH=82 /DNA_ID=CAMNT_0012611579 /DNA_START=74 /DNA_END=318 /DNA_ORIENTATION=-
MDPPVSSRSFSADAGEIDQDEFVSLLLENESSNEAPQHVSAATTEQHPTLALPSQQSVAQEQAGFPPMAGTQSQQQPLSYSR